MPERRTFLGAAAGIAGTALIGFGAASSSEGEGNGHSHGGGGPAGEAVAYVRNVEEVRGHLTSSATLLERGRTDGAALHAGHGSDYFAAVLPPVRNESPELATRLRARLNEVPDRVENGDADAYETYITGEVFPLLDRAVATVVAEEIRESAAFDVRVMNALAGRIAEEYSAAVTPDGEIELAGEYWDGRGFLTRIEARSEGMGDLGGAGDSLETLRSRVENVDPPSAVKSTTLQFRIRTTAAADLSAATVEGRENALNYVRNAEEVRGHLTSSATLAAFGSDDAALHAGHGSDYLLALLPAVRSEDPELADELFDRIRGVDDRLRGDSPEAYEQYVTTEVFPLVEEALATAVPAEFTDSPSFSAAVALALADRVEDEYAAAVTDEEVIELYGEYWDARGFLTRMEAYYPDFEGELDEETRSEVSEELEILRGELETARPPWDVANSVAALHELLDGFAGVGKD